MAALLWELATTFFEESIMAAAAPLTQPMPQAASMRNELGAALLIFAKERR